MFVRRMLFAVLGIGLCSLILPAAQNKENQPVPQTSPKQEKPSGAPADLNTGTLAEILLRLESIEKRLAALEKPERVKNNDGPAYYTNLIIDPPCPFRSTDAEKTVKVLILYEAGSKLDLKPECASLDHDLVRMLSQAMLEGFKRNKEKVTLIGTSFVEKFKEEHPNWEAMKHVEIARHFHADYLVEVEVDQFCLHEPGSADTIRRGHCEISLEVFDVQKDSENPIFQTEFSRQFPKTPSSEDSTADSLNQFRVKFLKIVARQLSWNFTAHPIKDDYLDP